MNCIQECCYISKDCIDHDCIKAVNGKTYQDLCYALKLLESDREFIGAINEVNQLAFENQLRKLFITLLIINTMSKPLVF